MRFARKSHITYTLGLLVLAVLFVAGNAYAWHPGMDKAALNNVTGEIKAIDLNHNTISLKADDIKLDGRDLVIKLNDTTKIVGCDNADISQLRVGDKVKVSYYEANDRFFADSISASGFYSHLRCS